MKKLTATMTGILFAAAIAFMCSTSAVAGPGHHGGHHHGHHGPHWRVRPVGWDDDCYTVKRCYINRFGERRCRWIEVCD
jgi:hypothetical protein